MLRAVLLKNRVSVCEVDIRAGARAAGKYFIYGNHNVPI